MPRERLSMCKVHEVLHLKWEAKLSNRAIARSCGISDTILAQGSAVQEYLHRAQQAEIGWPLPEDLDEDQLYELFFPKPARPSQRAIPEPDWKYIHTELKRRDKAKVESGVKAVGNWFVIYRAINVQGLSPNEGQRLSAKLVHGVSPKEVH